MSELGELVREVRALRDRLRREPGVKFLDLKLVGMSGRELELATLVVSQQRRTRGVGTRVMQAITAFCDAHGLWLSLVPSDAYGSDLGRLVEFYRRHGLEPTGELSMRMQRPPRRSNPDERERRAQRQGATGDVEAMLAAGREAMRRGQVIFPVRVKANYANLRTARFFFVSHLASFLDVYLTGNEHYEVILRSGPRSKTAKGRKRSSYADPGTYSRWLIDGREWGLSEHPYARDHQGASIQEDGRSIFGLSGGSWPPPDDWWLLPQVQQWAHEFAQRHLLLPGQAMHDPAAWPDHPPPPATWDWPLERYENPMGDERQRRLERAAALGDRDAAAAAARGRVRAPSRGPEPITLLALVTAALRDYPIEDVELAIRDWIGGIPGGPDDVWIRRELNGRVHLALLGAMPRIEELLDDRRMRIVGRWRGKDPMDAFLHDTYDVDLARTLVNYQDALMVMRRLRDAA